MSNLLLKPLPGWMLVRRPVKLTCMTSAGGHGKNTARRTLRSITFIQYWSEFKTKISNFMYPYVYMIVYFYIVADLVV